MTPTAQPLQPRNRSHRRRSASRPAIATRIVAPLGALLLGWFVPASGEDAPALPALERYIEQHCDFEQSQWCKLETDNEFADVAWPKDIPGREGCCHDPAKVFTDFNGAAFDGRRFYFHGGGHASYAGNEVYRLDLATLQWKRLNDPAPLTDTDLIGEHCPVPEDEIYAGHTYGSPLVHQNELHIWSQYPKCDGHDTGGPPLYGRFELESREWSPPVKSPHTTSAAVRIDDRAVVFGQGKYARAYLYDLETGNALKKSGISSRGWLSFGTATTNGKQVVLIEKKGLFSINARLFKRPERVATRPSSLGANSGIAYHPGRDLYMLWSGGPEVFAIGPDFEQWQIYADQNPAPRKLKNVFSKWRYVPQANVLIGIGDARNLWLFRPAEPIDPQKALGDLECSDAVPGAECPSLQKAIRGGGTVNLKHGLYRQCAVISQTTVIHGNGARIENATCQGKAAFVTNADTVIRNLRCKGQRASAGNGACVRHQKGDLTLDNVTISGSQNGVLANRSAGKLTIRNSRLEDVGGDCSVKCGRAHGVYYSGGGELVIRNSTLKRPRDQGHLVKTGASRTVIDSSVLDERNGNGSRIIDAFNGGEVIVRDSTLIAAPKDGNSTVIGYDYEARIDHAPNRVVIQGGRVQCAGGRLIAGRNSLARVSPEIRTNRTACR